MSSADSDTLLRAALDALTDGQRFTDYAFTPISGGTMASVWHGIPPREGVPAIAVRLTPKPVALINRIAELINSVSAVECPITLSTGQLEEHGRTRTVHVCTWIGTGEPVGHDPFVLGRDLALLHEAMAEGASAFTDRKLSFERGPIPTEQELPTWYVARHLWRDRINGWFAAHGSQLRSQPIHGDMHLANAVRTSTGAGFIDFDKLMHAPPVFDLAKLIATGFFHVGPAAVRLRKTGAGDLLAGYQSVRRLSNSELAAIEGFAVILNEETARLGHQFGVTAYQQHADKVGGWWTRRRRSHPGDPLGIRAAAAVPAAAEFQGQQLTLFP